MANTASGNGGLRLTKCYVDAPLEDCVHASGDTVALGIGDPVKTAGSAASVGNGPVRKTVARCASGDAIYGVVQACYQHRVASGMNLNRRHCPASTAMYIGVRPANNRDEYAIACDNEGATLAVGDVGLNANLTGSGGGTTITDCDSTTGMSTVYLDTSTKDTTATLQVKIVGFETTATNVPGTDTQYAVVTINNCEQSGGTGTAGV
jgi:hypothetical protein